MADRSDAEVLNAHTLQWSVELIEQLLESNEESLRIQGSLPPDLQESLDSLPSGYRGIAAAAALKVNPSALREANVWLAGCRDFLRSLSHRVLMVVPDNDMGESGGVTMQDEGLAYRVEELERELAEIREWQASVIAAMQTIAAGAGVFTPTSARGPAGSFAAEH